MRTITQQKGANNTIMNTLRLITPERKERQGNYTNECQGLFYVAQVAPEFSNSRIKMGFSTNINSRIVKHRVISPNIKILKTWRCQRKWERVALDYLGHKYCEALNREVFECHDIPGLIRRADKLFSLFSVSE